MARVFQAYGCRYAMLLDMNALEHTYLATYHMAGDNLVVDLDLNEANLPVGQRLRAGEVLLEITDVPHTGCAQFAERFGPDAVRYINSSQRKKLRLRGVFARVLEAGTIQVGDRVRKED